MPDADTDEDTPGLVAKVDIEPSLADRLRDAQQAYDEVSAYLDDLKDELRQQLKEQQVPGRRRVDGVSNGDVVFTYVRRSARRLNGARLKRDYPSIWDAYASEQATWYLTISREVQS